MNHLIEMGISIAALVAIFFGGIVGAREGLFRAIARLGFALLCFLVAARWWFPATHALADRFAVAPEQVSFTVFWGIYALLILPVHAALKTANHEFIPSYPVALERVGGFLCGAAYLAIISSAVLLSFLPNLPKILPAYDDTRLLLPIHRLGALIYRNTETDLTPLPPGSPGRTLLPIVERTSAEAPLQVFWR